MCKSARGRYVFVLLLKKKYMLKSVYVQQHYLKLVLEEVSSCTHTHKAHICDLALDIDLCVCAAHVLLRNFNLVEKSGMWDRLLFTTRF